MKKETLIIDNDIARQHAINLIMSGTGLTVTIEHTKRKRSNPQNNAMYKYFDLLAKELNDSGLDMRKVLTRRPDIPWSDKTIKEHIWWPVQEAMGLEASTAKLDKEQVSMVYEVVARFLSDKFGVYVPFPSKD